MNDLLQTIWEFLGRNAAILIALSALSFTAYETTATRKFNRLSVMPHITDFIERNFHDGRVSITWRLVNHGLGPAVIKSYSVFLDGLPIDAGSGSEVAKALVKAFGDADPSNFYVGNLANEYMMRKDESQNFLTVDYSAPLSELNEVDTQVERFRIVVRYVSVYGEEFTFDSSRT